MLKRFNNGNELLTFIDCDTPIVPADDASVPLTWAMVVLQQGDKFLLHHNFNRAQWECAGGGIEEGETVEEAAIREVLEETSQHVTDLQCRGIFKLKVVRNSAVEYGALYMGKVDELRDFVVNNESDRIILWHPDDAFEDVLDDRMSELSAWMIYYLLKRDMKLKP